MQNVLPQTQRSDSKISQHEMQSLERTCLLLAAHSEKTKDLREGVVGVDGVLGGWNTKGEVGLELRQVVALEMNPGEAFENMSHTSNLTTEMGVTIDRSCADDNESPPGENDLRENEETEFLDGEP